MKKALHITLGFILIASIQLSAVGVRLVYHYCGDTLKEVSLLELDETCCPKKGSSIEFPSNESCLKKGSCCSLEYQMIEGTDAPLSSSKVSIGSEAIADYIQPFAITFHSTSETPKSYTHANAPPLSGRDILVRVQRFLI
ncbi:HYC_CC_PP family protein [Phaeocystidibacter marisrubri]|uniref:Uncharacterized protein n=1 Tax=Phaeocystidibacter marisrubri TaxID=1577780 RepID=A0A6L3ZJ01_9FLAO|nr:hypothetical protein [Phaeocystidibacter marisrubri]KAB2817797.1 hypothetical protein F8C82_05170 [Phaeocystidibacter marisrubri]GGH73489.1 hypothetical protein GCM10011318_18560 [Phaeocystidibacter marisrubri]